MLQHAVATLFQVHPRKWRMCSTWHDTFQRSRSESGALRTAGFTPTVLDADYPSLTINGNSVRSGDAYDAILNAGANRSSIQVTAADGATVSISWT
jgi:hypothetical protein